MDVSIRRNVWDCRAQVQDKCWRAGVAVVIRLARLNNDLRRNQKKTLCIWVMQTTRVKQLEMRYNKSSTIIGRVIERWANGLASRGITYEAGVGFSYEATSKLSYAIYNRKMIGVVAS